MLYWILKPLAIIFYRIFYRYEIHGMEQVPLDQPVVFAPNHVNAFIDPILPVLHIRKKVRFFARGDVFRGKIASALLGSLNIGPMYRIQEGYGEIRKNDKAFEDCRRRLINNEIILLFPEAICVQERRLRPLKKGMARIVFQTGESLDFKKDVLIVPIGLNYTALYKFRSRLFIEVGKPVSMKEYEERFKQDKVRTINEFTKEFETKMAQHLVILQNRENDKVLEGLEAMILEDYVLKSGGSPRSQKDRYKATKALAEKLNVLDERDPEYMALLRERIPAYIRRVRGNELRDHLLKPANIERATIWQFLLDYLLIFAGMPFYGLGLLTNYLPYYLAKNFSDKKIRNIEFFASVYLNMAMLAWVAFYGLQLLAVALIFRSWPLLGIYAVAVPLLGLFCLWFYPVKEKVFGRWRLLRMVRNDRKIIEELISERHSIMEHLQRVTGE